MLAFDSSVSAVEGAAAASPVGCFVLGFGKEAISTKWMVTVRAHAHAHIKGFSPAHLRMRTRFDPSHTYSPLTCISLIFISLPFLLHTCRRQQLIDYTLPPAETERELASASELLWS